jgi:hypothetical protein
MNPNTATLRATDLQQLLGVSSQSLYRWMQSPYPLHSLQHAKPWGRFYALPEVVVRLRLRRQGGLTGFELHRLVNFDTATRAERGDDGLWLGDDPAERAQAFFASLNGDEVDRARACMSAVRKSATEAGLNAIEHLRQSILIYPAAVRFILTTDASELPAISAGWGALTRALWCVNPLPQLKETA